MTYVSYRTINLPRKSSWEDHGKELKYFLKRANGGEALAVWETLRYFGQGIVRIGAGSSDKSIT